MLEEFQIRPIPLQYDASKEELRAFLRRHELALEDDVEAAFGIFNSHDELSGCGCAAAVFNGYLLRGLREGRWKRLLFAPTGALLSPTSSFQGRL